MFNLFSKHCPICGMDVDKKIGIKRFGKYFCSEEHAHQYAERKKDKEKYQYSRGKGRGCC